MFRGVNFFQLLGTAAAQKKLQLQDKGRNQLYTQQLRVYSLYISHVVRLLPSRQLHVQS